MASSAVHDSSFVNTSITSFDLDLPAIKGELRQKCLECQQRGLTQTFKWLSETSHAMSHVTTPTMPDSTGLSELTAEELDVYLISKSYFDLKEYDRCAFFTKKSVESSSSPRLLVFLHFYSRYLSGEKKRLDDLTDFIAPTEAHQVRHLTDLRAEMEKLYRDKVLDGYCSYLYGIVLKRLNLGDEARRVLLECVSVEPCHWGAWLELSGHVTDRKELELIDLPDHWMKHFFLAHTYLELQLNEQALDVYFGLQNAGLADSTYIMAQIAIAFHNLRQVDQAVDYFKRLSDIDPYRLDNLDTYSNLLYVKEQRVELAYLAHKTAEIDKYRTETCCVIGNYYSLRSQHEKAVTYFQRALKLNPGYLSAWTLMGHEFIELKNTNAAIQSYRHAIEVNKRDYRAWYGLGQTYEMLKMPFYCLYYYKKAQELRPNDSRMLVALGESYEKLDKLKEAMKCFWKAHCVGDIEGGVALYQLARLFERTNEPEQAAAAYHQYITDTEAQGITERDQQSRAYKFLAQFFLKKGQLDDAYDFGQKCTEFAETREEGKAILKEIAGQRAQLQSSARNEEARARKDLEPMNLTFS